MGADEQDLRIVFDNVSRDIIQGIELASAQPETPIKLRYFIFVDGETDSQITPMELTLKDIVVNARTIQATAQRADLYKYYFPSGGTSRYDQRFAGLML